jgi:hypothetical protein
MTTLGAGDGTSYPSSIDSRQTYVNGPTPAPDSASRIDAELANDLLAAVVAIETILGANVQGVFGSLAARLNQGLPGGPGLPGIVAFTNAQSVTVPGATHNIGQGALLWQLYDAAIPAHAIDSGSVTVEVDQNTYDVFLTFSAPTSGALALGATTPLYLATFTNATTVSILGTTHQLASADLLFQVYDNASPRRRAMEPGSLTVHPTTRDVLLTFNTQQSGMLILSAGSPVYATSFTSAQSFTILGAVHQLGTRALVFQTYNAATPRAALGDPVVTVHPTTFDVTVTFSSATSGRFVLGAVPTVSGNEFEIRDSGISNQSATRVRSLLGDLYLQSGVGQHVHVQDRTGATRLTVDTANTRLGIGTTTPAATLQLGTGSAIKPGGGAWDAPSDVRQKEGIRPFDEGLDVLLQLEAVWFRYNGLGGIARSEHEHLGFVAQALQAIAPYMVRSQRGRLVPDGPETELLMTDVSALPYLLLNGFKTLHTWVTHLQTAQRELHGTLATIQTRLRQLEETIL